MASRGISIKVQDHGTAVDGKKQRIRCNHCDKVVSGFSRLKCHLGWVRGEVVPCPRVPADVKEAFSNEILERRQSNLSMDVGEASSPNLHVKRTLTPVSDSAQPLEPGSIPTSQLESDKRLRTLTPVSDSAQPLEPGSIPTSQLESDKRLRTLTPVSDSAQPLEPGRIPSSQLESDKQFRIGTSAENRGTEIVPFNPCSQSDENQSSSSRDFQICIGRFFFETGLEFDVVNSPSFGRMMNANHGANRAYSIPSSEDLKGWILHEMWKEMQLYVSNIRESWARTGCSILLDGWQDTMGRNLLNVLVACPKGTVYIRSADITGFEQESAAMQLFLDDVLKEVGVDNVVQIVTYTTSTWMEEIGKQLMDKHKNLFWTVSDSHCIQLMLEKIGTMEDMQDILDKAKTITRFVHSHASVLKLLRDRTSIHDLVRPSKFKFLLPFLTLENMVTERESIENLFLSSVWKTSSLAFTLEGRRVAELVADPTFWNGATVVLKATIPLVRAVELLSKNNEPQLGYIYETLDQVKETIKEEFKLRKSSYMPFWEAIDDVWNQYLHSPLHAAGYFLNPKLFYANDFYSDPEVASGLLCCIVRMRENLGSQDLLTLQIEDYRTVKGAFGQGSANLQSDISPESWWLIYGREHPQLQQLAIRILSQTCNGASKYKLKRSLGEKLLTDGRNPIEQRRLDDLAFVHYNLHLQNFNGRATNDFPNEDINPMDDWVVDKTQSFLSRRDELTWMDLDCKDATNSGGR